MDINAVTNQFKYLRKLRRMPLRRLRYLHKKTFETSAFNVKIPKWIHRSVLERRLFVLFCVKNYHYPKDHRITVQFREQAKHILSEHYIASISPEQHVEEVVKQAEIFSLENIDKMPLIDVDRYLIGAGIYLEATENQRRKVLFEYFNHPISNDIADGGLRRRRKGRLNNSFKLRDLILANPKLSYDDFMLAYSVKMPTVTRGSFNTTRTLLRKAGYAIPDLPKGPWRPVLVVGPYGHPKTSARELADLPLDASKNHG